MKESVKKWIEQDPHRQIMIENFNKIKNVDFMKEN